jgi:hypothetical protein
MYNETRGLVNKAVRVKNMNADTLKRPLWLKAAIILVSMIAFMSVANLSGQVSIEGYVSYSIRSVVFVTLLIGLIFNSIIARWLTVIIFGLITLGGVAAILISLGSSSVNYFVYFVGGAILLVFIVVTVGFAFSRNVRSYYKAIRGIHEATNKANPNHALQRTSR